MLATEEELFTKPRKTTEAANDDIDISGYDISLLLSFMVPVFNKKILAF